MDIDSIQALSQFGDEAALLMQGVEYGDSEYQGRAGEISSTLAALGEHGMAFGDDDDEELGELTSTCPSGAMTPAPPSPTLPTADAISQALRRSAGSEEDEEEVTQGRTYKAPETVNFWLSQPPTQQKLPPLALQKPTEAPRPGKEKERERDKETKSTPAKIGPAQSKVTKPQKPLAQSPAATGPRFPTPRTTTPTPTTTPQPIRPIPTATSTPKSTPLPQKKQERPTPQTSDKKKAIPKPQGKPQPGNDEIDSIFNGF